MLDGVDGCEGWAVLSEWNIVAHVLRDIQWLFALCDPVTARHDYLPSNSCNNSFPILPRDLPSCSTPWGRRIPDFMTALIMAP